MAVGAYAAWNFGVRFPGMPLIVQILLGGCFATIVGVIFGIPSLRIRGLYLAVATLAAQFFVDWAFLRIPFFTNYSSSGNVSVPQLTAFGLPVQSAMEKYLFVLILVAVFSLLAKNLVRGAIGRQWMAIRDMDVAASVIGIRPMYAKLTAFAVSSFIVGVAGALWGYIHLGSWEPLAFDLSRSFQLLFMVIIGGLLDHRQLLRRGLHRAGAGGAEQHPAHAGPAAVGGHRRPRRAHGVRGADRVLPHRRAARAGAAVEHRQGETAHLALPH